MSRHYVVLAAGLLVAPGLAQKADISIRPATQPVSFTIESRSEVETKRKVLIDGEEPEARFGRGGMGEGTSTTVQKVVFEEGPPGSMWRKYGVVEATVTRPGFDGEEQTNEIKSGLADKKIFIAEDDGGTVLRENDAKGEELPRNLAAGVPVRIDLSGLTPSQPVEVGEEFDLSDKLCAALKGLVHPIAPAREERGPEGEGGRGRRGGDEGEGQGRRRRGGEAGGEGGEARGGQRGQGEEGDQARRGRRGGEGGFGGGGRFRMRGASDAALQALTNDKLECTATGKLVSVENGLAIIAIDAKMTGKGTARGVGLSGGMFGGRRGRGGRGGGGDEGESSAEVTLGLKGTVAVRVADHQLKELELSGDLKSKSKTVRPMGDRGDMEVASDTQGSFSLKATCATAAPKKAGN